MVVYEMAIRSNADRRSGEQVQPICHLVCHTEEAQVSSAMGARRMHTARRAAGAGAFEYFDTATRLRAGAAGEARDGGDAVASMQRPITI